MTAIDTKAHPATRVDGLDWTRMTHDLNDLECAMSEPILSPDECSEIVSLHFPMQVVVGLNEPGVDHTGGEFLMLEQRPRAQSRGTSTTLGHGRALVFTTSERPVEYKRGWSKAPMRHGVSVVRSDHRHTLALVLHDAE